MVWRETTEYMALHALLQSDVTVMITTATGVIQYVNPTFERRSGYSAAEAVGQTPDLLKAGDYSPDFLAQIDTAARSSELFRAVFANRSKAGQLYHEEQTITPIQHADGSLSHYVFMGRLVTSLQPAEASSALLPRRDALTGIADRQQFIDRLGQTVACSARDAREFSLLHIDVDRFRRINDTLGHHVGDRVLAAVAQRIGEQVDKKDMIARLGGDEFTIIVTHRQSREAVEDLARSLIRACSRPFAIGERALYAGISIGIASYPQDGHHTESLLRHAEIAMYRAKSAGRGSVVNFNAEMEIKMLEDLSIESALRSALARGEFEIHYQPIVSPANGRVVALEALLRWHSPQHGEVSPTRFVPMLEETGLIASVGRWVLKTACTQFKSMKSHPNSPSMLAVNLSGQQFRDAALIDDVQAILSASGLAPQQLELEITENILIEDASAAARTLHALAALGVRLAIDDFGTGYSSLSYLRRFPINTLKIDRSFVAEIETSQDAQVITRAIVNLAHNLAIEVVAEGVENPGQLALLAGFGCAKVQGFLFSRPLPMDELEKRLEADLADATAGRSARRA